MNPGRLRGAQNLSRCIIPAFQGGGSGGRVSPNRASLGPLSSSSVTRANRSPFCKQVVILSSALRIVEAWNCTESKKRTLRPLRKVRTLRSHDLHKQSHAPLTSLLTHTPLLPLTKHLTSLRKHPLTLLLSCHRSPLAV